MSGSDGKVVLVAVDGSKHGDWAFHAAVHRIDASLDRLVLVSVAVVHPMDQLAVLKAAITLGANKANGGALAKRHARLAWGS